MNRNWDDARMLCVACVLWFAAPALAQTSTEPAASAPKPAPQEVPAAADAAPAEAATEAKKFSMADLELIVSPIALYPDVLLAQVLPASTVPIQVIEAARYSEKNPGKTEKPVDKNWEPPVVSLLGFPDALKKLNEDLSWLQHLGDAVIVQLEDVMTAIQNVRKRVNDAGALPSNDKQTVVVEKEIVKIVPADPEVVYVPTYNPSVIYVDDDDDDEWAAGFIGFGAGMLVGAAIWDDCDWDGGGIWHHGDVDIDVDEINIDRGDRNTNIDRGDRETNINRERNVDRSKSSQWKPSATARTEHQARQQSEARARNSASGVKPSNVSASQRQAQDRMKNSSTTQRNSTSRPSSSTNRSSSGRSSASQQPSRSNDGNAFGGSSSGSAARQQSTRGNTSRSGSYGGGSYSGSRGGSAPRGGGGGSRGGGGRGGGGRR